MTMTAKERILCAMKGGTPDRVPVQLGVLSIAPIFSKSSFWDVYYHNKFDLRKLMVEMVETFGFDGYLYSRIQSRHCGRIPEAKDEEVRRDDEYIVSRTTWTTPGGELFQERTFPYSETPTTTRGMIKNKEDFELYLEYFLPENPDIEWDDSRLQHDKKMLGEKGVVGATMPGLPGVHALIGLFDDKLEGATYFLMDYPDLIEEYRKRQEAHLLATLAVALGTQKD